VGPSLPEALRVSDPRLEYRPPVRRGDLAALPSDVPPVTHVGIVDGEFHQSLAVSPREIMALLRAQVAVYGSSSMGALRAAELHPLGMQGVGRIFAMYRDGEVASDDEVAIVFDPDSQRALTEPLVNVRCAVSALAERGELPASAAEVIVASALSLHYTERSYRAILRRAADRAGLDLTKLFVPLAAHDQKRLDALELCSRMKSDLRAGC